MFLVAWWLTGVFLGWVIWTFYRIWRRERWSRGLSAGPAGILGAVTKTATAATKAVWARLRPKRQPQNHRPVRRRRPVAVTGWRLTRAAFLALFVIAFAAATDHAQLLQCMLVLKSYLVGVRVQTLVVGILSGIAFRQYRWPLRRFGHRLGKAVIGDKENTAWALQGAVAVGLIAVGLFAVRPDFLLYLRSFKFGTVEATFGDQGPLPLRDARLNLREFREKVAVRQYRHFRDTFISANSPRGLARRDLTSEKIVAIQPVSGEIASLLFEQYVDPVLSAILCLDEAHALNAAIHDADLSLYSSAWQDFLLRIHRDGPLLTRDELKSFLVSLPSKSAPFIKRVREAHPECPKDAPRAGPVYPQPLLNEIAANQIGLLYERASGILDNQKINKAAIRSLRTFDPYLAGAAADLITLISGEGEKTDFLMNILGDLELPDDDITPGIINLYYQVTYSGLNSIGPLPLDLIRSQIEYATHGVDIMMARSASRLDEIEERHPAKQPPKGFQNELEKAGERENLPGRDAENMSTIYGIFLRNSFATLTAEVDLYVQRVLADEKIPEGHRQSWIKAAGRLQTMLQARLNLPVANIDGLFPVELDARTKARLRADEGIDLDSDIKIDPDFLLQADLAVALTAVLLPDTNSISTQNCTAALFYVNEASASVRLTVDTIKLDKAQEQRLRQLIRTVANRVSASCNWTDSRNEAKPSEAKAK